MQKAGLMHSVLTMNLELQGCKSDLGQVERDDVTRSIAVHVVASGSDEGAERSNHQVRRIQDLREHWPVYDCSPFLTQQMTFLLGI
jgi:predicted TIM-barrel enzyme